MEMLVHGTVSPDPQQVTVPSECVATNASYVDEMLTTFDNAGEDGQVPALLDPPQQVSVPSS